MDSYQLWKLVHLAGAFLFLGNNVITPFWRFFAERTRDPQVIAYSQRLITLTDFTFTGGGIVLLLLGGHAMAAARPELWEQAWFAWSYGLFVASGVLWGAVLLPVQREQAKLARGFSAGGPIPPRFWTLCRRWTLAGTIASVLPLFSLYLMVMKPTSG